MIRLNLLPPEIKEDIAYAKKNAALFQILAKLLAGFALMLAVVGVVGYIVYTNSQIATEEKEATAQQVASWKNTEKDAVDFSNRLNLVSKIDSEKINWPAVFAELAKSTPNNVKLSAYDFKNNATDRVGLSGYAVTNADIGTFREILARSKLFQYVDIESTTQATDPADAAKKVLSFRITMNLNQAEARK
jgi:Tfp pilus assembly protein PilN